MGKAISKYENARDSFLSVIKGQQESLSAFLRTSLVTLVTATGDFIAASEGRTNDKGKPISRQALFEEIVTATDHGVSLATLRRWAFVADQTDSTSLTEGSASALYALTESGMTEAKAAYVKATEGQGPTLTGDAIVTAVAEAINANPKALPKAPSEAPAEVTAENVTGAAYSLEAFRESVTAMLSTVPEEDQKEARAFLRALANQKVKATV